MKTFLPVLFLVVLGGVTAVAAPSAGVQKKLDAISAEGKLIAANFVASGVAFRKLREQPGFDRSSAPLWVTLLRRDGWLTVIGSSGKRGFVPAYAFLSDLDLSGTQPLEVSALPDLSAQLRAIELSRKTVGVGTELGPLTPVLMETSDNLVVYVLQEPKDQTFWVMGGDHRLTVSKDGKRVLKHRKLHKGAIRVDRPKQAPPEGAEPSLFHNHLVGMEPLPSETDVAFAILNRVELAVAAPTRDVYRIAPEGSITVDPPAQPDPAPAAAPTPGPAKR